MVIESFGRALPDLAAATKVWRDLFPSAEEVYTQGDQVHQGEMGGDGEVKILAPTLCVGAHFGTLCVPSVARFGTQSVQACVPTRSVGTRRGKRRRGSSPRLFSMERPSVRPA